jgi:hypothetical protein
VAATFRLAVDPERLHRSSSGGITGQLAIQVDGTWFPEQQWSDFPVVVLGWWLQAWQGLAAGEAAVLRFMDGPYQVVLSWQPDACVDVALEDSHRSGPRSVTCGPVSPAAVSRALGEAALSVVRACDGRGWGGQDIDALRALSEQQP